MDNGRLTELLTFKSNYKLHFLDQAPGWETVHQKHQNIKGGIGSRASHQGHPEIALWTRFECFLCDLKPRCWITSSPLLIHCKESGLVWSFIYLWGRGTLPLSPLVYSSHLTMFWCDFGWEFIPVVIDIALTGLVIKPIIKKPQAWLIYRLHALRICPEWLAA